MKWTPCACLIVMMLAGAVPASGQVSESGPISSPGGTPLTEVVAAIGHKINKKLVVDPRADTRLSISPDATKISYSDFLDVLEVHGLVAVERGDVICTCTAARADSAAADSAVRPSRRLEMHQ